MNKEFLLTIRNGKNLYLNIVDSYNNAENIIQCDNENYNVTNEQFDSIKKLTNNILKDLINISLTQTPTYLIENGLDGGFQCNLEIVIGGMSICVNAGVSDKKTRDLISSFVENVKTIIK